MPELEKNNLPDLLTRWGEREGLERERPRSAQSFCVSRQDIADANYELSLNHYKEIVHKEQIHDSPTDIIGELRKIDAKIETNLDDLEEMLG